MLLQMLLTWMGLLTLDYLYEKTRLMHKDPAEGPD